MQSGSVICLGFAVVSSRATPVSRRSLPSVGPHHCCRSSGVAGSSFPAGPQRDPRHCIASRTGSSACPIPNASACGRCRSVRPVSYTHLRAHETDSYLVCRLLLEKKKKKKQKKKQKKKTKQK